MAAVFDLDTWIIAIAALCMRQAASFDPFACACEGLIGDRPSERRVRSRSSSRSGARWLTLCPPHSGLTTEYDFALSLATRRRQRRPAPFGVHP
ncbi:hypothetical protein J3F83DRAFT_753505 [Trichoderma novae-zelandiae]